MCGSGHWSSKTYQNMSFYFFLRVMVHMHIDIKAQSNMWDPSKEEISTKNCSIPYEEGNGHMIDLIG